MKRARHIVEELGPTVASHLMWEEVERMHRREHHPLPLAIVLQFWAGDQARALRLARFLADLEPELRTDIVFVFARRYDVPGPEANPALRKADEYCKRKFPTSHLRSERVAVGHPDGAFGLWAGSTETMYQRYLLGGWPSNVMYLEAEGVPLRWDWIDSIKRTHYENLLARKRVTGARMEGGRGYCAHVNGSMVMHLSCWGDKHDLHECPKGQAWDVVHGVSLLQERGERPGIVNLYGAHKLSMSVYKTLGHDYAWLASVKDESAWRCAQSLLHSQRDTVKTAMKLLNPGVKMPWEVKLGQKTTKPKTKMGRK